MSGPNSPQHDRRILSWEPKSNRPRLGRTAAVESSGRRDFRRICDEAARPRRRPAGPPGEKLKSRNAAPLKVPTHAASGLGFEGILGPLPPRGLYRRYNR